MKNKYWIAFALLLASSFAYFFSDLNRHPEVRILTESISPNSAWVLTIEERIYGDGLFVNEQRDEARIGRRGDKKASRFLLFSAELDGVGEINATWINNQKLRIQFPEKTRVFAMSKKYLDIEIEYAFL